MIQSVKMVVDAKARLEVIVSSFVQAYFGHVGTNLAMWAEIESFCHNYVSGLRNAESRKRVRNRETDFSKHL